ncbi:hypothetical protein M422DRAFT_27441 [Sphaerobolus stellatus SS14]|nr:hypothetical protein M422DRAFT_27441 [Sphaerobolus stellatus SS14]
MPKRSLSFIGRSGQSRLPSSLIPSCWRNYVLVVWSFKDEYMLQLELEESWSDHNYLRFKRVPFRQSLVPELIRRKVGMTNWPDESIIVQGINIIRRGPPYKSGRWHFFWPDHQSFVEELAQRLIHNPKPSITPVRPLVYYASEVSKNWDKAGPPMAVTFEKGEEALSEDWIGGKKMLRAYPGGPNRVPKT